MQILLQRFPSHITGANRIDLRSFKLAGFTQSSLCQTSFFTHYIFTPFLWVGGEKERWKGGAEEWWRANQQTMGSSGKRLCFWLSVCGFVPACFKYWYGYKVTGKL